MKTHYVFENCPSPIRRDIEAYWEKRFRKVEKLVECFGDDLPDLRLNIYRHPQRDWYQVRAVLYLPSGTLVAEATAKDVEGVLQEVLDRLTREVKKHKELIRHDQAYRRKRRRQAELEGAAAMLQADMEAGRRQAFFDLLKPMLASVRDHARRELRILELEGKLEPGSVTADDLVDEVMERAWERYAERPARLSLDLWLIDLLHEVVRDWTKEPPHESLEEEVRVDEPPDVGEQEWWAALLGYDEPLYLEDLIPGYEGTELWEQLDRKEQRDRLLKLLGQLPEQQRQALMLSVVEGYDLAEIAMIQDRSEEEIRRDIEEARKHLREALLRSGELKLTAEAAVTADQRA